MVASFPSAVVVSLVGLNRRIHPRCSLIRGYIILEADEQLLLMSLQKKELGAAERSELGENFSRGRFLLVEFA